MPTSYRFLALGALASVGVAFAGHLVPLVKSPEAEPEPPPLLPTAYAHPAELTFADTLRTGETLSELLQRSEFAEEEARALLEELRKHDDPRRLQAGSVISYRKAYLSGGVRALELRLDADRGLTMRREAESWNGWVEHVPVRVDTTVLSGEVKSTLYAALLELDDLGIPAEERRRVGDVLAERIFPWQIDFSRDLQPGDDFRILYERVVRPDGTSRTSKVLGVQLTARGRQLTAYPFRLADGREEYYDATGESLRRAFLRAPVEFRRISSVFSRSRFHPVLGINRPHHGTDYAAPAGTPVRAVGEGVVTRAGWSGGYGNLVEIRHARGYASRYAHLRGFAGGLRVGKRVRQGELIGYVGMTGLATGPHLHYEFHANGQPIDPSRVRYITGEPLAAQQRVRFRAMVEAKIAQMDRWDDSLRLAAAIQRYGPGIETFD